MKYGIYTPNFGEETSAQALAELAAAAEASGWDGFFIWDHILYNPKQRLPLVDPWVALAAMATATRRIRLGTTVTPVARRRPWVLARQTVSLDHLSKGRLILSVGLGDPGEVEFAHFGENPDPKARAEKLDEGLEILAGLWSGQPFSYRGRQYRMRKTTFLPASYQQPRIPVWVGGFWPHKAPFRRAARWDGCFPLKVDWKMSPEDFAEIREFILQQRQSQEPFDMVKLGKTPGAEPHKALKIIQPYARAGATWWLENLYMQRNSTQAMLERIRQGPPGEL